jgi:hypothetical protein
MRLIRFTLTLRRTAERLLGALGAGLLLAGSGYASQSPRPSEITFAPPIALERLSAISMPVIAADWDRDGQLDIAAMNRDGYWLLYGNGDGTFDPAVLTVPGEGLHQCTAADVNRDGLLDMVVLHNPLGRVLVLLNQGGRTFSSAVNYPVGAEPVDVLAEDFNGDGAPDLAVSNHRSHGMSVLLNRGDGRFHTAVTYGGANHPGGISSADFNEDGRVDLAQANLVSGNVRVFLGDGKGSFTSSGAYGTNGSYPNATIAKDFDGDGHTDLAVANVWGHSVSLLFGDGKGSFGVPVPYTAIGYPHGLDDGDFDGDGDMDLVAATDVGDHFVILQNHEAGNFLPPARLSSGDRNTRNVIVADFNADGRPDIVVGNQPSTHLSLLLNTTGAAVLPPPPPGTSASPPVYNPANGHWYQAIRVAGGIGWDEARAAADRLSYSGYRGHLATITSAAENQFIIGAIAPSSYDGLWLGGYQDTSVADFLEPAGGWRWITGEAWGYTDWTPGEPNNNTVRGPENHLHINFRTTSWNDVTAAYPISGYLVEYEPAPTPRSIVVQITPNSVTGGGATVGYVILPVPSGPGGTIVTLTSSQPSAAVTPVTVTVPAGVTASTFQVISFPIAMATTVVITASGGGLVGTGLLQVLPPPPVPVLPTLVSLSLSPTSVIGSSPSTGTVSLSGPAPKGGVVIALSTGSAPFASTPATVTVPEGTNSATFTISTQTVTSVGSATITATLNDASRSATLAVEPPPAPPAPPLPTLVSLSLAPTRVAGGNPAFGAVTLSAPAPKGGVVVALSVAGSSAATPATVTVSEGDTIAAFPITTEVVSSATSGVITATLSDVSRTATLAIEPIPSAAPKTNAFVTPTPTSYGWNNTDVTVALRAEGRGVAEIHYSLTGAQTGSGTLPGGTADFHVTAEGVTTITFFARNPDGQTEAAKTLTVRIDRTPPVITYSGNQGTYSIEQGIHIGCSATDALSGIADDTCENFDSIAWLYSRTEPTVLESAAVDKAGNLATASTYFFVRLNPKALMVLTQQATPKAKVAKSLCSKLESILGKKKISARARAKAIASFLKAVKKERGRSLAADKADLLLRLAAEL